MTSFKFYSLSPIVRTGLIALTLAASTVLHAAVNALDPFDSYLKAGAPEIIKELPLDGVVAIPHDVEVKRVIFHSRLVQTADGPVSSDIYAVIARPVGKGEFPGILVLHGGGGHAEFIRAIAWARLGYIAVAPDLPGVGNPQEMPDSSGAWKKNGQNEGRWTTNPDVTVSAIFDTVIAGIQSFHLLQSQPNVMKDHLGIIGISWGGYTTTMLSGLLGNQVQAAFSLFGSGYYDKGTVFADIYMKKMPVDERETWLRFLDAGRRAKNIKANYFIAAASNDAFFYPPSIMATLDAISSNKNQVFSPNVSHQISVPGGTREPARTGWTLMEQAYFNYYLKGEGAPFPIVIANPHQAEIANGKARISFSVNSSSSLATVSVYTSIASSNWTKRKWVELNAKAISEGHYEAEIPMDVMGTDWFALVSDSRNISVSTPIYHITQ